MKKTIVIVCNGKLYPQIINNIRKNDFIIGVDRAAYWLIKHGCNPNAAIGDFDSTNREEFAIIKKHVSIIQTFSCDKDFTDTELALKYAIHQNPSKIIIYGGTGTRLDHTMGTLSLLEYCQKRGIPAVFRDKTNEVMVVGRGRTILKKREGSRYVSVVPITNSIQITLLNFKYEIVKKTINRGQTVGISNEFINKKATVVIHSGRAFVIQSRD